jgi:outer membrane putative beta-barrel porin/alpha-amylase
MTRLVRLTIAAMALVGAPPLVAAQELEPGLYQNAPINFNLAAANILVSRGNVLFDSALPIEDATADVQAFVLGYVRTLSVAGKAAKLDVQVPMSWAHFTGLVSGDIRTRSPAGLADPRVRLAVNIVGSPALAMPEFVRYRQRTIVGLALQVVAPLGQYDPDRLINLGSNRWSFRPEVGVSRALGRLTLEFAAGAWVFTANDDFFGGQELTQRPLYFAKGAAIWSFRGGRWVALNYGRANGGQTSVDGDENSPLQENDRIAATLLLPMRRTQALRLTYTSGLSTRLGADFDTVGVGYQFSWTRFR